MDQRRIQLTVHQQVGINTHAHSLFHQGANGLLRQGRTCWCRTDDGQQPRYIAVQLRFQRTNRRRTTRPAFVAYVQAEMLDIAVIHLRPCTLGKLIIGMVVITQHLLHHQKKIALEGTAGIMLAIFHQRAQGTAEGLLGPVLQGLTDGDLNH